MFARNSLLDGVIMLILLWEERHYYDADENDDDDNHCEADDDMPSECHNDKGAIDEENTISDHNI